MEFYHFLMMGSGAGDIFFVIYWKSRGFGRYITQLLSTNSKIMYRTKHLLKFNSKIKSPQQLHQKSAPKNPAYSSP